MMTRETNPPGETVICGGHCLLPEEGLAQVDIRIAGGEIAEIAPGHGIAPSGVIDARGKIVLPGIVDIHGDAFERQIMPRPNTVFPLDTALIDTDRQLATNGITTAFHGITISWEPGLRSLPEAQRIVAAIDKLESEMLVDHRLHVRWETFAVDEMSAVIDLFRRTKRPLLAFNDHTLPSIAGGRQESKIKGAADRAMVDVASYRQLLGAMAERAPFVEHAIADMAAAARRHSVTMLSHDDNSPEMRRSYRELGANIAEFPLSWEAVEEAAASGDHIVLGAPNVVRGGSHNGAISAEEAVIRGQCGILASDYYYPAPLHAALSLWRRGVLPLPQAWALISANPARVVGLEDRGTIAVGKRADLIIVDPATGRLAATLAAGRPVLRMA